MTERAYRQLDTGWMFATWAAIVLIFGGLVIVNQDLIKVMKQAEAARLEAVKASVEASKISQEIERRLSVRPEQVLRQVEDIKGMVLENRDLFTKCR